MLHNTTFKVQIPNIAGHSLKEDMGPLNTEVTKRVHQCVSGTISLDWKMVTLVLVQIMQR